MYRPLRALIEDMTRPNPADRPPTIAAVCERLSAMATALQPRRQQHHQRPPLRPLLNSNTASHQKDAFPAKSVTTAVGDENVAPAAAGGAMVEAKRIAGPGVIVRQQMAL